MTNPGRFQAVRKKEVRAGTINFTYLAFSNMDSLNIGITTHHWNIIRMSFDAIRKDSDSIRFKKGKR